MVRCNMLNEVVKMDNLKFLLDLEGDSVDLIYSDILYNTGRKFEDFDDDLGSPMEAIDWYRPRLIEMKRILKDTGTIYLHCDYRLVHYLKVEMDNIFGIDNFRNEIIWHYNSAPRKKKDFGGRHDSILRYTKTSEYTFNVDEVRVPYSESAPRGYAKEKYYNKLGKVMGDVWEINIIGQNDKTERVGYSTQKPKELLEIMIKASSNQGELVADFFGGSGTTGVVAKELNRNYLLCDISDKAVNISRERLSRTIRGVKLNEDLGDLPSDNNKSASSNLFDLALDFQID